MPKRFQNRYDLGYPLGTPKNTIFDVKTSPRWLPKISDFFQKSCKNSSYDGLWSKMPLGSLQEPAKSLPRAVPEPSRGPPQPSSASRWAPKRIPRACFADLSTFFDRSRDRYINFCGHLCFIDALHHGVIICPLPFFVATTFEHLLLPDIVSAFQHRLPLLF